MSNLGPLLDTLPNWFSVTKRFVHSVEGDCLVVDDSSVADASYALTVEEIADKVYAREAMPGTRLPAMCFDRHIMDMGHFCLGLGYGSIVKDVDTARHWWESLEEFLRLQGVASSSGRWPRHIELDHGMAGIYHRRAIDAAAKLDCSDDYELALLGRPSWIGDSANLLTADGKRLVNVRSPCPRGCLRNRRPVLRADCCDPDAVAALIANERMRQIALAEFWASIKNDRNAVCCGTMTSCPLRTTEEKSCAK